MKEKWKSAVIDSDAPSLRLAGLVRGERVNIRLVGDSFDGRTVSVFHAWPAGKDESEGVIVLEPGLSGFSALSAERYEKISNSPQGRVLLGKNV